MNANGLIWMAGYVCKMPNQTRLAECSVGLSSQRVDDGYICIIFFIITLYLYHKININERASSLRKRDLGSVLGNIRQTRVVRTCKKET